MEADLSKIKIDAFILFSAKDLEEKVLIKNKTINKNEKNWGISGRSLNKAYMTDLINNLII